MLYLFRGRNLTDCDNFNIHFPPARKSDYLFDTSRVPCGLFLFYAPVKVCFCRLPGYFLFSSKKLFRASNYSAVVRGILREREVERNEKTFI